MNRQPMLGGNGFAVSRNLNPNLVRVESLKPLGRETRKHPPSQIRKLQASIEQFGFVLPVVIDVDSRVIAGWGLAVAAKRLGLTEVPAVTIADLDEAKLRMLRLALNRLGEDSGWDLDALKLEFSDILEISSEIDLRISGFEMGEIDVAFFVVSPLRDRPTACVAERNQRPQSDQAIAAKLIRALLAGRAVGDVIELRDEWIPGSAPSFAMAPGVRSGTATKVGNFVSNITTFDQINNLADRLEARSRDSAEFSMKFHLSKR